MNQNQTNVTKLPRGKKESRQPFGENSQLLHHSSSVVVDIIYPKKTWANIVSLFFLSFLFHFKKHFTNIPSSPFSGFPTLFLLHLSTAVEGVKDQQSPLKFRPVAPSCGKVRLWGVAAHLGCGRLRLRQVAADYGTFRIRISKKKYQLRPVGWLA